TGLHFSPILMRSTTRRRLFTFPSLPVDTFQGLPPMIADAAPDRLAYVGTRAMGALTFTPDNSSKYLPTALGRNRGAERLRAVAAEVRRYREQQPAWCRPELRPHRARLLPDGEGGRDRDERVRAAGGGRPRALRHEALRPAGHFRR